MKLLKNGMFAGSVERRNNKSFDEYSNGRLGWVGPAKQERICSPDTLCTLNLNSVYEKFVTKSFIFYLLEQYRKTLGLRSQSKGAGLQ